MSTGGIAFLVAFPLMIVLIVWVIWSFLRDQKKGTLFITDLKVVSSPVNAAPILHAKKSSPWQLITFGLFVLLIGIGFYWYWDTQSSFFSQERVQAVGLALIGLLSIYWGIRNWLKSI